MKKILTTAERDVVFLQSLTLRNAVDKYDDTVRLEANKALLGNCYIYDNRYSSDERWPLYQRVIGVKAGYLVLFRFQTDSNGKVEVEPEAHGYNSESLGKPCSVGQFNLAWRRLRKRIDEFPHG